MALLCPVPQCQGSRLQEPTTLSCYLAMYCDISSHPSEEIINYYFISCLVLSQNPHHQKLIQNPQLLLRLIDPCEEKWLLLLLLILQIIVEKVKSACFKQCQPTTTLLSWFLSTTAYCWVPSAKNFILSYGQKGKYNKWSLRVGWFLFPHSISLRFWCQQKPSKFF